MIEILDHIIGAAVASNSVDKYGFPSGGRRQPYDNSTSKVVNLTIPGGSDFRMVYELRDKIVENAERMPGDFHTPTAYYISQSKIVGSSGQLGSARPTPWNEFKPYIRSVPTPRWGSVQSFGLFPNTAGKAASMLNAKILDQANQWSAMVDAAELGQTVGLFRDLSRSLLGVSVGVIRRDPKLILESFGVKPTKKDRLYVRNTLRAVKRRKGTVGDAAADLWLQYRYGIRPLVKSLEDYRNALLADYNPELEVQVTYVEETKWTADEQKGSYAGFDYHYRETGYAKRSVRYKAVVSFADSLKARIRGNPVAEALGTAWELIPYSFVLDWIVKVGDYINQLNLPTLLASYRCVETVKDYTRFEGQSLKFAPSPSPYPAEFRGTGNVPVNYTETRSFRRSKRGIMLGDLLWGTGLSPTLRQLDAGALAFAKLKRLNSSTFH